MAKKHGTYFYLTLPVAERVALANEAHHNRLIQIAKRFGMRRGWTTGLSLMPTALPLCAHVEQDAIRKSWEAVGEHLGYRTDQEAPESRKPYAASAGSGAGRKRAANDVLVTEG